MILVIAEQRGGALNRATWEVIAAAQEMAAHGKSPVKVAVVGSTVAAVADELAQRIGFFIVDVIDLVDAEKVDFAPPEEAAPTATTTASPVGASAAASRGAAPVTARRTALWR